jgi:hypothetical protein
MNPTQYDLNCTHDDDAQALIVADVRTVIRVPTIHRHGIQTNKPFHAATKSQMLA